MQLFTKVQKRDLSVSKVYGLYDEFKLFNVWNGRNTLLSKASPYLNLSGNLSNSFVLFIRNFVDEKFTQSFYKPSLQIVEKQFYSLPNFRVFSYPNKIQVLFGKWFDSPVNTYFVDIQNTKINGFPVFFNFTQIIEFTNFKYHEDWFIFFENLLLKSIFRPKYEFLLYPLTGNRVQSFIYMKFEHENKPTVTYVIPKECKDDTYMSDWDLTLHRPRYMFSTDGNTWMIWDKTNNQWKIITPSNNDYFTFEDFLTQGMTYSEYLQIPEDAFSTKDDWYVLTNNFIPMFSLKLSYIDEFVGAARFMSVDNDSFERRLTIWTL